MITRIKIYLPRLSPASNLTLEFYATENWPLQTENLRVSQDDPRLQSSKCHSYLKFSNQLAAIRRASASGTWGCGDCSTHLTACGRRFGANWRRAWQVPQACYMKTEESNARGKWPFDLPQTFAKMWFASPNWKTVFFLAHSSFETIRFCSLLFMTACHPLGR